MNKKINVFVYGSLRESFFNYDKYLKGKVISIKPGKIHNMVLYHMPYKGYPALLKGTGTVYGEIMEINPEIYDETMKAMDEMEGFISENNPQNEYEKKLLKVEHLDDKKTEQCYVYFYNKHIDPDFSNKAVLIPHGDWVNHMCESKKNRKI
ncbi:gamma-glutamylcyclotransferase family protein [Clostridium butyricum]|uniref:gamma-glutamylcyclotransferase family protein n=1 Tax=Clostridium butyricum TaxID=1492 RepID=UPI003D12A7C2